MQGRRRLAFRSTSNGIAGGAGAWFALLLVSAAYLATTTGEALLAPIYPVAADELGLDLTGAGVAFAALALAISVFTIIGGLLLRVTATTVVLSAALLTTSVGGLVAATASSRTQFLAAQVLLGAGAGLLYPAAVMTVGVLAGPRRRGFAMAVFGVFFSSGLALAAGLAALGGGLGWRWPFGIASALAGVAAVVIWLAVDAPRASAGGPLFAGLLSVLGTPTVVGVVGGVSQYATVSFLPVFAVEVWDVSGVAAAGFLLVGRVLSVPAKLLSGVAADRLGPEPTARAIGAILAVAGLCWALSPSVTLAAVAGILFAAEVSALFPLANLLAFDRVGSRGPALGAFRSLQLGAGAIAGVVIGAAAHRFGLRPTLAVVALVPLALIAIRTRRELIRGRRHRPRSADRPWR